MGSAAPVFEIPTHCKAGIIEDAGPNFKVKVAQVPVPTPGNPYTKFCSYCQVLSHLGPDDILIKLNVTGLCQSDLHYMLDDLGNPTPPSIPDTTKRTRHINGHIRRVLPRPRRRRNRSPNRRQRQNIQTRRPRRDQAHHGHMRDMPIMLERQGDILRRRGPHRPHGPW